MSLSFTPVFFVNQPIQPQCRVTVVIPVRDEAEHIAQSLRAFTRQVDLTGKKLDERFFEVLILANNCQDDSIEIIKMVQRENRSANLRLAEIRLPEKHANIGYVRRVLMNEAALRLKAVCREGILMTTDGDTIVADDWIAANMEEIRNGADAVGGRIVITDAELEKMNELCRRTHLLDEEYRLLTAEIESVIDALPFDKAPRHHQHFNASFACTTEIYEKADGVPEVKFLEDCAFFDRLQRIDARVRHSPGVKVYTSSRHVGRSEVGLSYQLNQWKNLSETGADFLVESAPSIIERLSLKRDLRKIWRDFSVGKIDNGEQIRKAAARFCVAPEFITRELAKLQAFGAFYENLQREQNDRGEWTQRFPPVALDKALHELKAIYASETYDNAPESALGRAG